MNQSALGFTHFLSHADGVTQFILAAMLLASFVTWSIILDRSVGHWLIQRRSAEFLDGFRSARCFSDLAGSRAPALEEPYTRLARIAIDSSRHYSQHDAGRWEAAGGLAEFLTRALRQGIDDEVERLERGLTLLASIGSTAPFVGLFGTVWGIYHALLAIGLSGQGTLDKVAGPVGEALIMTAIGLAVAIPAVLGYNALVRRNRVVLARLDAFGHDLLTLAVSSVPMARGAHASSLRVAGAA